MCAWAKGTSIAFISRVDKSIGSLRAFEGRANRVKGAEGAKGTEGVKGAKAKREESY